MKKYELPLHRNYVRTWGMKEAIRELVQNAIDGDAHYFEYDGDRLVIGNKNSSLGSNLLLLGNTSKHGNSEKIGQFGEGFKLALLVLTREGYDVSVNNADKVWTPTFQNSEQFGEELLVIEEEDGSGRDLEFVIDGISKAKLRELKREFLPLAEAFDGGFKKVIECDHGQLIIDEEQKGNVYVAGLFVQHDDQLQLGYNFNPDVVKLDRDRKAINIYELRRISAQAILSADEHSNVIAETLMEVSLETRTISDHIHYVSDEVREGLKEHIKEQEEIEDMDKVAFVSDKSEVSKIKNNFERVIVVNEGLEEILNNEKVADEIKKARTEHENRDMFNEQLKEYKKTGLEAVIEIFGKVCDALCDDDVIQFKNFLKHSGNSYGMKKIKEVITEDFVKNGITEEGENW